MSRDFLLQFFFTNHLPQAPENNIWVISILLENLRRYSQVKVIHQYQRHWWQIFADVNDIGLPLVSTTGGKFCHQHCWCCWYQWQIFTGTTTPGANNGNNIRRLSWHLKWTWRKKFIYMLTLLPKGVQKNNKNFSDFFHFPPVSFPPVSMTPVVHLELRLSPWIF